MESALIDQTSEQFLGQWKRLVSTTNWEKGQIIHGWREALRESGAPASEFSDDAWSRRVANVTPQHVGRLRRVFERFAETRGNYPGLYWSHFQAALDWDDAEMWLEGAVHSDWSISEMREKRWEVAGASAESENGNVATATGEADDEAPWDEDAESTDAHDVVAGTLEAVRAPERATSDAFDDAAEDDDSSDDDDEDAFNDDDAETSRRAVRPFASLPPLPADVNDAFEAYKLCILRHKLAGWQDIARDDLLASLDALKQLALAPTET